MSPPTFTGDRPWSACRALKRRVSCTAAESKQVFAPAMRTRAVNWKRPSVCSINRAFLKVANFTHRLPPALTRFRRHRDAEIMELQTVLGAMVNQAGVKTVYSEPVTVDGRTIVPVARVRLGFGGGSGHNGRSKESEGGGGFVARPVGFVE